MKPKRTPHIVMILYASLPVDPRVKREAQALARANFRVTVLDADLGYGEWDGRDGIKRVPLVHSQMSERQSFISLLKFWLVVIRHLWTIKSDIDVIHAHDLTGLPPAWVIATLHRRIKLVYDSHELFPEAARDKLTIWHYIIFLTIELICGRRVDVLITVSPMILEILEKRLGCPSYLIMNVPDIARFETTLGEIPCWNSTKNDGTIRIAYSGIVNIHRGYEELVLAAKLLNAQDNPKYEFWIIGHGPFLSEVQSMAESMQLSDCFVFTGKVEHEDLLNMTARCDIAVALYSSASNNNLGLSNKLFEYMMLGMPIIFTNLQQSHPILRRIGATIVENPATADGLAESILSLINDPEKMLFTSNEGRQLVTKYLNWQVESQKLVTVYQNLFQI